MSRLSIKGVLIGGIVDLGSSAILGIPLVFYAMHKLDIGHMPKDQVGIAVTAAMQSNTPLYILQWVFGGAASVLGGYTAARLAKHDELLNGALSCWLCTSQGFYSIAAGKDSHPFGVQLLMLFASPALAFLGGYLMHLQKRSRTAVLEST